MLTYQHAAFVRESLDSVLVQDYPNMEIVVGDDASTDGTQDILRDYAGRHPGVFKLLLSPVNRGITANSKSTLMACEGELIAHTSGDDVWLPGKLHKQVKWAGKTPGRLRLLKKRGAHRQNGDEGAAATPRRPPQSVPRR